MATKKKVDDEAGDTAEVVDTEALEAPGDDAPAEVEPEPEESTPVDESVDAALSIAQSIVGVPATGAVNHATRMALRKFQQKNGLPPSGSLDARTKAAMHIQIPA